MSMADLTPYDGLSERINCPATLVSHGAIVRMVGIT